MREPVKHVQRVNFVGFNRERWRISTADGVQNLGYGFSHASRINFRGNWISCIFAGYEVALFCLNLIALRKSYFFKISIFIRYAKINFFSGEKNLVIFILADRKKIYLKLKTSSPQMQLCWLYAKKNHMRMTLSRRRYRKMKKFSFHMHDLLRN